MDIIEEFINDLMNELQKMHKENRAHLNELKFKNALIGEIIMHKGILIGIEQSIKAIKKIKQERLK